MDSCQFQTCSQRGAEELRVVVDTRLEVCNQRMLVVLGVLTEGLFLTFGNDTRYKERHTGEGEVVHKLVRLHVLVGVHPRPVRLLVGGRT